MRAPRVGRIVVTAGAALAALLCLWYFGIVLPEKPSPVRSTAPDNATRPSAEGATPGGQGWLVRLGGPSDSNGGSLLGMAALSGANRASLATTPEQFAQLQQDATRWLTAYGATSATDMARVFSDYSVAPPPSWTGAEESEASWRRAMEPLARIDFELARSTARPVALKAMDTSSGVQRCGRRNAARDFLPAALEANQSGVELLFFGSVPGDDGTPAAVRFGITLAWNPGVRKWVVVRTCLYDFPNSFAGSAPIL